MYNECRVKLIKEIKMKEAQRVKPCGWLYDFLKTQLSGLTGHIEEAGFPYDTVEWGAPEFIFDNGKPEWWVYEQTAYWVDGLTRTAILLEDREALHRAEEIIYRVIDNPDIDGYIGPRVLKTGVNASRWPHVVFFRACMALYEYNRDERIVRALCSHYLNEEDKDHVWRDVDNVEILLWLFGITGDRRLLEYAESSYEKYNARAGSDSIDKVALSRRKPYEHGVSHNEYSKLGAILYMYTGKKEYLRASLSAYKKVDRFFMLPGGCLCSNEYMHNNMYYQSYETCNISDMSWSLSYLFSATGDGAFGDKIERCVFNAGLGSVTEDFRALQYYSSANQVFSDSSSNHNNQGEERGWMRYSPNPGTACCPGNVNRFMPNYILNMWQKNENIVTSRLLGPSEFSFRGEDGNIRITVDTSYPFEDTLRYVIETDTPFTLRIRKPRFALSVAARDNEGHSFDKTVGDFLECSVDKNTVITLKLECELEEHTSGEWVYLTRGPLVYSLMINEDRRAYQSDSTPGILYPDYSIRPLGEWRYSLTGDYTFYAGDFTSLADKATMPYISAVAKRITNQMPDKRDPKREGLTSAPDYNGYTFTPRLMKNRDVLTDEKNRFR